MSLVIISLLPCFHKLKFICQKQSWSKDVVLEGGWEKFLSFVRPPICLFWGPILNEFSISLIFTGLFSTMHGVLSHFVPSNAFVTIFHDIALVWFVLRAFAFYIICRCPTTSRANIYCLFLVNIYRLIHFSKYWQIHFGKHIGKYILSYLFWWAWINEHNKKKKPTKITKTTI